MNKGWIAVIPLVFGVIALVLAARVFTYGGIWYLLVGIPGGFAIIVGLMFLVKVINNGDGDEEKRHYR